jgi:uncharacterized membrane protein
VTKFDKTLDEQRMDAIIGNLLRIGVVAAGAIVFIGGIIYLVLFGKQMPEYQIFHGQPENLTFVGGIFREVFSFNPRGIIQLGILLLIATPVARVAFSVYAFARQRDFVYIIVTLFVLATLIFSLAGGHL